METLETIRDAGTPDFYQRETRRTRAHSALWALGWHRARIWQQDCNRYPWPKTAPQAFYDGYYYGAQPDDDC